MFVKVNKEMTIYQIVAKARANSSEEYRNVHYYDFGATVLTAAQMQLAVDTFDGHYKTHLQPVTWTEVEYYAHDIRRVDTPNEPTIEVVPTGGSWSGQSVNQPLPPQVSLMVSFKALTPFPRNARSYLFGLNEGNNDGFALPAAGIKSIGDAWGADMLELLWDVGETAFKVAVKFAGTPRTVTDFNRLTTVSVKDTWATQRRRVQGVGA